MMQDREFAKQVCCMIVKYLHEHPSDTIQNLQTIQIDMARLKSWYTRLVEDNNIHLIHDDQFLEAAFGYDNHCNEIVTTLVPAPS